MAKSKRPSAAMQKTIKLMKEKAKKRKSAVPKTKPSAKLKPVKLVKPVRVAKPEASKPPVKRQYYSKQDLEYFRKIILDKKKEILEELETLRDSMMDNTTGEYASENSTYSTHMEQGTDAMEREKNIFIRVAGRKILKSS